jgi:hypothetical protein
MLFACTSTRFLSSLLHRWTHVVAPSLVGMKVVRILSVRPTKRVRHSSGKTISEYGHLISVTICTTLVSGNSKLNFYDWNMMNITIRHTIYCLYPNPIWEFKLRKKNYLYLYPQYPFVSDPFSSLLPSAPNNGCVVQPDAARSGLGGWQACSLIGLQRGSRRPLQTASELPCRRAGAQPCGRENSLAGEQHDT